MYHFTSIILVLLVNLYAIVCRSICIINTLSIGLILTGNTEAIMSPVVIMPKIIDLLKLMFFICEIYVVPQ